MSRALYHLSYGTEAGERLTGRLRPCLELPLLYAVLRDRDALPLVHIFFPEKNEAGIPPASWLLQMVAEVGFEPTTFGL
jgi:hypothetical protein